MKLIHKQLVINPVLTYLSGDKTKGITRTVGRMNNPDGTVTENRKAVESAKNKYPMLANLDFSVYSDPNYRASDYDDYGDIEVFHKGEQKIDYTPEYSYPNPNINQDNVLYNPDRISERYTQDAINLDAISHLGHNDPTYDTLNAIIGNEYPDAATSEMLPLYEKMTGKNLMKMPDSKRPTKNKWIPQVLEAWDDAPRRYQNAIDGLVRDYIISKEHPNPNDPIYKALNYVKYNPQWDSKNNAPFYLNQLYDYITTGRRPANILPEVIVTGHKHADGGFKDGGKMYDDGGVISSNGQYHVNPTDYLDVLSNVENNKPVEVTLPDVTVKAADPKNYRSSYDPNGFMDFMNTVTLGVGNRFSVSQDARLVKDIYDAATGNKSWKDVGNSAILGNSGVFKNSWANLALDVAVPTTGAGIYKLASLKNSTLVDDVIAMKNYGKLGAKPVTVNEVDKLHYPDYIMPLYKIRLPKEVKEFYHEMLRRIKDNFDVDSKDLTESFSKQSETPVYIGKYDDPRYSGTHMMNTGESYVNLNDPDPISTAFHEAARHGTEDALLKYAPKAWRGYTDFIDTLKPYMGHLITESSKNPAELRATLGELYLLVHRLVKLACKNHASELPAELEGESINLYERFGDITNHKINDILTDDDLLRMLELTNAYGLDYANTLKAIKKEPSRYMEWLLDNLKIVSLLLLQLKQPNISKEEVKEISDRIQLRLLYSDLFLGILQDSAQEYPKAMAKLRELLTKYPMFTGAAAIGTGYGMTKHKNGGKMKIHIKKKNEGKFTSYCGGKVTQDCIDKAKASGNSKLVKRAVFAENVRKWKH